jgi:hypothetical protein
MGVAIMKNPKINIYSGDEHNKVCFHLVRVDSVLDVCPKCDGEVFKPKVHRDNNGLIYYSTVCVKCDYEHLDGTYVSTINDCKDECKVK